MIIPWHDEMMQERLSRHGYLTDMGMGDGHPTGIMACIYRLIALSSALFCIRVSQSLPPSTQGAIQASHLMV